MSMGVKRNLLSGFALQEGLQELFIQEACLPTESAPVLPDPPRETPSPVKPETTSPQTSRLGEVANILARVFELTLIYYYAKPDPTDPEDPGKILMPVVLLDVARKGGRWSVQLLPCDPDLFIQQKTYDLDMYCSNRYTAIDDLIGHMIPLAEPDVVFKAHQDRSYTVSAPSALSLLRSLRNLYQEQEYYTLDTYIGHEVLRRECRPRPERKYVFASAAEYGSYLVETRRVKDASAKDYPSTDPEAFMEDVMPMVHTSLEHAAYCSLRKSESDFVDISFSDCEVRMARYLGLEQPQDYNPLLNWH